MCCEALSSNLPSSPPLSHVSIAGLLFCSYFPVTTPFPPPFTFLSLVFPTHHYQTVSLQLEPLIANLFTHASYLQGIHELSSSHHSRRLKTWSYCQHVTSILNTFYSTYTTLEYARQWFAFRFETPSEEIQKWQTNILLQPTPGAHHCTWHARRVFMEG